MPAIETTALTKVYGDVTAVDGLDLTVRAGEIFGFLGPNGAGKSTTIALLMDYIKPSHGEVKVLGSDPQADVRALHNRIGILPDRFSLYDRLTGEAHLDYAIDAKGAADDPKTLLSQVGLTEAGDQRTGKYSHGMQQRLALAMALVGDPELLILDEPFTGLDPNGAKKVREIVYNVNEQGTTVFFSSHVLGQVALVCDRVGILNGGQLVAEGAVSDLRTEAGIPDELIIETTGVPDDAITAVESVDGVVDVERDNETLVVSTLRMDNRRRILRAIEEAGTTIETFSLREASVEEIFTTYAGE
ncbi:ABC transporter ATP-binding protein [Halocatena marina]|uniref:ATP-binding cassette domain-containing protein n=1 Tax=Halocatena marina TaxID=2934937 RepID=A0ABD5YME4_9EURY|nr:ABC transporter ATP-binding protein [Halocatena marina]